jgi:hypothetical protein
MSTTAAALSTSPAEKGSGSAGDEPSGVALPRSAPGGAASPDRSQPTIAPATSRVRRRRGRAAGPGAGEVDRPTLARAWC